MQLFTLTSPKVGFYEVTPTSWDEAKALGNNLASFFVFRGQSNKEWSLKTTIERAYSESLNSSSEEIWKKEKMILQRFKTRAHHYLQSPPNDNDFVEWFSIIQDYGGPTRLLDFTESFYIASYFAMQDATNEGCVWAINCNTLFFIVLANEFIDPDYGKFHEPKKSQALLEFAEKFISNSDKSLDMVLVLTPPRLNERLAIQKVLFLFPCNISKSFERNLCKAFGFSFDTLDSSNALPLPKFDFDSKSLDDWMRLGVIKINLPKHLHGTAMRDLNFMNIDPSTLFPGLEGFARSLWTRFGLEARLMGPGIKTKKTKD
jgi:hypothetical protein